MDATGKPLTSGGAVRPDQPDALCGLVIDRVNWVRTEAPQRIRETRATLEQRAKCQDHLDQIFAMKTIMGARVHFDPNDVAGVMKWVAEYLKNEPVLIEDVPYPITVVGDLNGNLHDLARVFLYHEKEGKPGYEFGKYLFLGNYVCRGTHQLEVLMALFCIKILYPDNFIILRGNHEFLNVNKEGQKCFYTYMLDQFSEETATSLYYYINEIFAYLSVAAIIGGQVFCVHAGISNTRFTRVQMRSLRKPIAFTYDDMLINDLVWSDPAEGLKGTCFNSSRQTSICYGEDAFAYAMHKIGCIAMLRGHTKLIDGFELTWERCYTIFSCTNMDLGRNHGSFAVFDENMKICIVLLRQNEERRKFMLESGRASIDERAANDEGGIKKM